jgi:hypothetical protein
MNKSKVISEVDRIRKSSGVQMIVVIAQDWGHASVDAGLNPSEAAALMRNEVPHVQSYLDSKAGS